MCECICDKNSHANYIVNCTPVGANESENEGAKVPSTQDQAEVNNGKFCSKKFIIKCNVYYSTVNRTGTNTTGVSSSGMPTLNTSTELSAESIIPTSFSLFNYYYYCKLMSLS